MEEGLLMSQAIESIDTMSPPKKKKPPARKKSSSPSVQSNNLTSYFRTPTSSTKPPPPAVAESPSVASIPSFNMVDADCIGNFRYPKAYNTIVLVTPVSSMDRTSLFTSNSVYTLEKDDDGSGIDMDRICRGCQNPYCHCMEKKWRKVCLHSVIDFFKEHDFDGIQRAGICEAYYKAFMMMMKAEIVQRSGYWECSKKFILPQCMREGSLEEAYEMMNNFEGDDTFEFFVGRCVYDVMLHLDRLNGVFRGKSAGSESNVSKR